MKNLKDEIYHVKIDSSFCKGHLNYGEILIPGKSNFSQHISVIHPWQITKFQVHHYSHSFQNG